MIMNKLKKDYFKIVDLKLDEATKKIEYLITQDRLDEANHEKIRRNVIDIFKKMYDVSLKKVYSYENKSVEDMNLKEFRKTYLEFFDTIPMTWLSSLQKAKENNDHEKIFIEELKIETKDKVKSYFEECWEGLYV
ncbi:hypothetical protein KHQ82_05860 [Mycoplasmatota bacterium]|nr:hypothetical protein KHQ82_05860 [Mycoplasmatota bacterium]